MNKKFCKLFLIILLLLLISKPAESQWVFDFQFNPPGSHPIYSFSVIDSSYMWIVTGFPPDSGKFYKKINSNIIELNSSGIFRPGKIIALDSTKAYLNAAYQMLYYTTNSGNNWIIRLDSSNGTYLDYSIAKNQSLIVASLYDYNSFTDRFYKSTDNGFTWNIQTINLPAEHYVWGVTITDSLHIWLGVNCQALSCAELLYLYSTNGGLNWLTKTFPLVSNNTIITPPVFNRENTIGYTFSPGYYWYRYRSANGGENWSSPVYFAFGNTEGLAGILNIDSTQIWLCAKSRNVYKTTNDGITWNEMNISLNDSDMITYLGAIRKSNKYYAYIGTTRGTIYKLVEDVPPIGIKTISNEVPASFSLYQNYPNPFNPVTTIKFDIPKDGNVTLEIYDMLGRVAAVLAKDELKKAGSYQIMWDASTFASGVYFYRLKSDKYIESKKMILIK